MHGYSITSPVSRAQRSTSSCEVMRCRTGTVPICGGPGSAGPTRALSRASELKLRACPRAAPHPGHEFLPSHPHTDAAAADALVGTIAEAGIELHVIIDPHRRVEREPIGALESAPVHCDREALVGHQGRHPRH